MCSRKQTIRQPLYITNVKALNLKILFCFVKFMKTNNIVLVKYTKCNINVCIERSNTLRHNARLNVMEVILTSAQGIFNMIRNIKYFTGLMWSDKWDEQSWGLGVANLECNNGMKLCIKVTYLTTINFYYKILRNHYLYITSSFLINGGCSNR